MKGRSAVLGAGLALALCFPGSATAQEITLAPFGGTSFSNPYYVDSPPGDPNRVMVVESAGRIRLVKDGVTLPAPFADLTDEVLGLGEEGCGGCGLLSIAFAPDYDASGLFYVFYTADLPPADGSFAVRVDEMRRSAGDADIADPAYRRHLLDLPYGDLHYGGQLAFGPDGYLYMSTGDGHDTDTPQDLTQLWGKLLRIDPRGTSHGEYRAAPGNPYADGLGPAVDEIYARGLRNPWRFSFDRATGDIAIADVQEDSWEEVNFVREGGAWGANFGWPCWEATHPNPGAPPSCDPLPAQTPPVLEWPHPPVQPTSVTGGYVVRDPSLPSLYGRYVYADSGQGLGGAIRSARLLEGGAVDDSDTGLGTFPLIVSFGEDACGHVYVSDIITDTVGRIEPAAGPLRCKLAPTLSVTARLAKRRRTVVLRASCDEDCDLVARGSIRVRRGRGSRPFSVPLFAPPSRAQMGEPLVRRLKASARPGRRLHRALRSGGSVVAPRYSVTASGGGGGSETVSGRIKKPKRRSLAR